MTHILPSRRPALRSQSAWVVFAVVYIGALAIVFAPKGSFIAPMANQVETGALEP